MRGKKTKSKTTMPIKDQGKIIIDDKEKAEILSQQYYHVSSDENLDPSFKKMKEDFENKKK